MSETIYIISGLGADQRVFCNIDFSSKNVVYINWIQPLPNEKLDNYALRLSAFITNPNPIIIGLSFGGIVAVEIAKLISTKQIILISSVKYHSEIPIWYKLGGALKLNKIIPFSLFKKANFVIYYFFGVNTMEEKQLLKTILQETDTHFLKWAVNCIVNWKNNFLPKNIIQIHGTKDLILPYRKSKNTMPVQNGGHLMIHNKAKEIQNILNQLL